MITTLLASVLLFAGGCSDNFDDSALWKGVDEIYNQLTELGKQADELNSQVRLLASVVNGGVVTSITQDAEGNNVVRYKGADNVEHSVTVATKNDVTTAPILGTKKEGGVLYWTTTAGGNTDFLKDTDGAKLPVAGRTPEVAVDKEGYWTVNGRRLTDAAGSPLKAEGKERSLITGISRDAAGNAVFTLGDGSTVSAPVFDAFNIVFKVGDTVLGDEYVVEDASQPLTIGYEITGEKAGETILKIMRTEKQGRQAHRPGNRRSRHGRSRCGGVRHGIGDRKRDQQRLDLVRGRRPRRSAGDARGNRRADDRYDHRRNLRSGGVRQ